MAETGVTIYIPQDLVLPDNNQWTNRFKIRSETSNRVYTIAQHKTKRHWACNCPSWLTRRYCKHLRELGVPNYERPYEPRIERR